MLGALGIDLVVKEYVMCRKLVYFTFGSGSGL